ncbi:MAG: hypothetical protein ACFCVK_22250 [Acidimicrobiales bacterium]
MEIYVRRSGAEGASRSAVETTLARDVGQGATVVVEVDSVDRAQLEAAKANVVAQFAKARSAASIGLSLDETCGKVVALVDSSADARLVDDIMRSLDLPDDTIVPVVADAGFETIDRYDYHNPQIGGLSLQVKNFLTGAAKQCTSAIPFHNGSGSLYAITAAHCLPSVAPTPHLGYYANVDWYQGLLGGVDINAWGGSYYVYGGQLDVAVTKIISSASAGSSTMWHGGNHSTVAMNWWKWHHSLSKKNDPVCHSGVNWGHQVCGIITDVDWDGTVSGVSFDGLFRTNMTGYPGDSGGTVWSDLPDGRWYVGVMAAANPSDTLFTHVGYIKPKFWWLQAPVNMF